MKRLSFVGFDPIFSNLLMSYKIRPRLFFSTVWRQQSHVNIIHCMGPRLRTLSVKLNTCTLIIQNHNFWFSSYWIIGNNIFHHRRTEWLFFFIVICFRYIISERNFWNVLKIRRNWFFCFLFVLAENMWFKLLRHNAKLILFWAKFLIWPKFF